MRESNFAFPAQNKACVCITSQLYDRRALDTTSPLPLFNSLTHLTYLTSTSPRIREIMTMDGGLERLVRLLHEFCLSPPPAESAALFYGLSPPPNRNTTTTERPPAPVLNPATWDKSAAFRFSLAFQCVVNIGVRGSENIRARVVQAGALDVVGCVLEGWLVSRGFSLTSNAHSGSGSAFHGTDGSSRHRETREQRHARRQAQAEQRQREEANELALALHRQIQVDTGVRIRDLEGVLGRRAQAQPPPPTSRPPLLPQISQPPPPLSSSGTPGNSDTEADMSTATTPVGEALPSISSSSTTRERSGTLIARSYGRDEGDSGDTSRNETETETEDDETTAAPRQRRGTLIGPPTIPITQPGGTNDDAHINIIVNDTDQALGLGDGIVGMGAGAGIAGIGIGLGEITGGEGDDFAMGAPPGAPGAVRDRFGPTHAATTHTFTHAHRRRREDETPRAGVVGLPLESPTAANAVPGPSTPVAMERRGTIRANRRPVDVLEVIEGRNPPTQATPPMLPTRTERADASTRVAQHRDHGQSTGICPSPYRDEDVLFALQLLAYLSKYPHVRQAFYKLRGGFHPTTSTPTAPSSSTSSISTVQPNNSTFSSSWAREHRERGGIALTREYASMGYTPSSHPPATSTRRPRESSAQQGGAPMSNHGRERQTNVFSLVERFTFRPSSTAHSPPFDGDLPSPATASPREGFVPRLPPEIQYWAGVIMRNACRKDEARGGVRQCANMLCGRWESYPREFAKCRRCRKAKYCGKECQSVAWSEGHRFWCCLREGDPQEPDPTSSTATDQQPFIPGAAVRTRLVRRGS